VDRLVPSSVTVTVWVAGFDISFMAAFRVGAGARAPALLAWIDVRTIRRALGAGNLLHRSIRAERGSTGVQAGLS
jgi:hypothetical protein